jgi:hypothetical protein
MDTNVISDCAMTALNTNKHQSSTSPLIVPTTVMARAVQFNTNDRDGGTSRVRAASSGSMGVEDEEEEEGEEEEREEGDGAAKKVREA